MNDEIPQIYKDMYNFLTPYLNQLDGIPLPSITEQYLNIKRAALSNAFCRAEDTADLHLSWMHHHWMMTEETSLVDLIAWETMYNEVHDNMGIPISVLECLKISINSDPMQNNISVVGLKPPLGPANPETNSNATTPMYVALAVEFAEENDWDITELYPPLIGIDMSEVGDINDYVSKALGKDVDIINELSMGSKGLEVWLA